MTPTNQTASQAVTPEQVDVLVIGGGQAGLATGYWLARSGLSFVIVDDSDRPGGAWNRMWPSLRAFSPATHSSLPGRLMPTWPHDDGFPPREHVEAYLADYEKRYDLPVGRPVRVQRVRRLRAEVDGLADTPSAPLVVEAHGPDGPRVWHARAVVSATGTWSRPFVPSVPGMASFEGTHLHSAQFRTTADLPPGRVVIVGGGNTGPQLLGEISRERDTLWCTLREPRLMPDGVDGRVLFDVATARRAALDAGLLSDTGGVGALGDIVMVPPVVEARERGVLQAHAMFDEVVPEGVRWHEVGQPGSPGRWREEPARTEEAGVILWCTGYRAALSHLAPLGLRGQDGRIATEGTRAASEPRLHLMGYGDWTGFASATLIGVGRPARAAVNEIVTFLDTGS